MSNPDTNNIVGPISLNAVHVAMGGTSGTAVSFNDAIIRNGAGITAGAVHDLQDHYVQSPFDLNTVAQFGDSKSVDICSYTGDFYAVGHPNLPQDTVAGGVTIAAMSNFPSTTGISPAGATRLFGGDVTISALPDNYSGGTYENHGYFVCYVVDNGVTSLNQTGKIFGFASTPQITPPNNNVYENYATSQAAINGWVEFTGPTFGLTTYNQGGPTCMHQDQSHLAYIWNNDFSSGPSSTNWKVVSFQATLGGGGIGSWATDMDTTRIGNEIGTANGWNSAFTIWPEAVATYVKTPNASANTGQLSANGGGLNTDWIAVGLCRGSGTNPTGPSMVGLFSNRFSGNSYGTGFIIDGADYNYDDVDNFGINVTMSNNYLVIMSTSYSTSFTRNHFTVFDISGEAPVFKYRRDNPYGGQGEVGFGRNESYYETTVSKHFTRTLSISGDTRSTGAIPTTSVAAVGPSGHGPYLVVGNPQRFSAFADAGKVYIFHLPSGALISTWGLFEINNGSNEQGARYGATVSMGRLQAGRSVNPGPDVMMVTSPGDPGLNQVGTDLGDVWLYVDINPET